MNPVVRLSGVISKRFVVMLVLAFVLLSVSCSPRDDEPVGPEVVFAGHSPGPELACGYSRAELSPDGSMFTLLESGDYLPGEAWPIGVDDISPSRSAVIDTACFVGEGSLKGCQVGTVQAGPLAMGARAWWSDDSRHLFVNAGGRVGAFVIDPGAKRIALVDEPREHRFINSWTLAIVGPTSSKTREQEWRRIREAEDWFVKVKTSSYRANGLSAMRVTLGPEGMSASGTIAGSIDLGAVRPEDGRRVENTGYLVSVFQGEPRPMLVKDETGVEWLVGVGEALRRRQSADGARFEWEPGPKPGLYGKRPIIDSATGRFLGVHTERDIVWAHPKASLDALRDKVLSELHPESTLHQVSVSSRAGTAVVLHFNRDAVEHLALKRDPVAGDWRSGGAVCRREKPSVRSETTAQTYDAGEPGWPVMARIERREGNRRLVVVLHGGPGRTVLFGGVSAIAASLERNDRVSYDPSGTIGVDATVAERLARYGAEALERDARLIVADIKRLAPAYDEVVLYAVSYGGALVPAVASGLGEGFVRAYLEAPLAYHHHPLSNQGERAHAKKNHFSEGFSVLFHELHFGNRRSDGKKPFDRWLADQYRGFTLDQRFTVVQGSKDELSRPGDIPNPGQARMVVVDGGHASATSLNEHVCWIDGNCAVEASRAAAL